MTTKLDRYFRAGSRPTATRSINDDPESQEAVSAKIERIAYELDAISELLGVRSEGCTTACPDIAAAVPEYMQDLARCVSSVIRARRERANHLPSYIFADPAWDMLLNLFHSELLQHRTAITDLCISSQVPPSTAMRWISTLAEAGLTVRRPDPLDRRRVYIELTSLGRRCLHSYFESVLSRSSHKAA